MLRSLFYAATYWAPALLVLLGVAARAAAPYPYDGVIYGAAIEASLVSVARTLHDTNNLYVRVEGRDPSPQMLMGLNSGKSSALFVPWSSRSPKRDRCVTSTRDPIDASCMEDNFLSANFLSMPLWHVALVRVNTAACAAELTLVLGPNQWHVVSQRSMCT